MMVLACGAEPAASAQVEPVEDPRIACVRQHAVPQASGAAGSLDPALRTAVVRALCAELHDLGGVSASVAIARDDAVVLALAIGPRCHGGTEPLRPDTPLRIGSITKLVTTALALTHAERQGLSLDAPLPHLPELEPAPSLRALLTHTAGLRDPEPHELLTRGDRWPEALQLHRQAPGTHAYANANFLLVGRWLERSTGLDYATLLAEDPTLAPVRDHVRLTAGGRTGDPTAACGHVPGWRWQPLEPTAELELPAWTLPAGGGLASAEDLARLPFALERSGLLPTMLKTRVPSDRPGWNQGLGVRMQGEGDALVLAHAGNPGVSWAELQWSPRHRVAVAVLSSTPQPLKATLHAAFTAALAETGS